MPDDQFKEFMTKVWGDVYINIYKNIYGQLHNNIQSEILASLTDQNDLIGLRPSETNLLKNKN